MSGAKTLQLDDPPASLLTHDALPQQNFYRLTETHVLRCYQPFLLSL